MLIDSGATHSFALPAFIRKMKNVTDIINRPFSVMVPSGEILNSGELGKACEVSISGKKLCIDLIILEMHDYDVIFGMDWLSKHYAKVDCKKKELTFRPPQKESFTFKGECKENRMSIISSLKATKLLNGGCEGYLASVFIETEEQRPKTEDIPVVNDFPEVLYVALLHQIYNRMKSVLRASRLQVLVSSRYTLIHQIPNLKIIFENSFSRYHQKTRHSWPSKRVNVVRKHFYFIKSILEDKQDLSYAQDP